jgi:P4 family phage/plasmid primase-like protien
MERIMTNLPTPKGKGKGDVCPPPDKPTTIDEALPEISDSVAVIREIGARAYGAAAALAPIACLSILAGCAKPWDGTTAATFYYGGTFDTRDGDFRTGSWKEFGDFLASYSSTAVAPKGAGAWFTPAISENGRCRDRDILSIVQLSLDCDGAGDWDVLRDLLDKAGLAYIVQRSSSHKPEMPKWHVHIPLYLHWSGSKKEWQRIYRHTLAWFAAVAGLRVNLQVVPPEYGFDPKPARLGQPWFIPARRNEEDPVPETVIVEGAAFDCAVFLSATGFDPEAVVAAVEAAEGGGRVRGARAKTVHGRAACEPGETLLELAFEEAGMLGPVLPGGGRAVKCPWENSHTSGTTFDSSTVLFPPKAGSDVGWFHCSHGHCEGRSNGDAFSALPPEASAKAEERYEMKRLTRETRWAMRFAAPRQAGAGSGVPANDATQVGPPGSVATAVVDGRFTDAGNAKRLVRLYGSDLRYCHPWGKWLGWDGVRWAVDERGLVNLYAKQTIEQMFGDLVGCNEAQRRMIVEHAFKSEAVSRLAAMVSLAQSEPGIPVVPDELDADDMLLNVENGIVDLRTGKLLLHDRAMLITKLAPVVFDPNATCPLWEQFLDTIFQKNKALIAYVQKLVGYALSGDVRAQIIIFLYGIGANGKTTFLETLLALMGNYATQAAPNLLLEKKNESHPTELADLFGRRFVISTEVEQGRKFSEALVKQLTGGDRMKARYMRQDFFDFRPTHKLFIAANHKPIIHGCDEGIWRRMRVLPFNVVIPKADRDEGLMTKLAQERSGILNWAIQGCLDWQKSGLDVPQEVEDATSAYREEMDRLGGFLDDECVLDTRGCATSAALRAAYVAWCNTNGEEPIQPRTFGMMLKERGFESRKSHGSMVWHGVRVKAWDERLRDRAQESQKGANPAEPVSEDESGEEGG